MRALLWARPRGESKTDGPWAHLLYKVRDSQSTRRPEHPGMSTFWGNEDGGRNVEGTSAPALGEDRGRAGGCAIHTEPKGRGELATRGKEGTLGGNGVRRAGVGGERDTVRKQCSKLPNLPNGHLSPCLGLPPPASPSALVRLLGAHRGASWVCGRFQGSTTQRAPVWLSAPQIWGFLQHPEALR